MSSSQTVETYQSDFSKLLGKRPREEKREKKKSSMLCISDRCFTEAVFNVPGQTKGLYCKAHKKDGMMDVRNNTCISEGCLTRASFNIPGLKKGLYCKVHKQDGMINVLSKTCISEGCLTIAIFNFPGQKKGLYCKEHKKDGMVDVRNNTCISEGCLTKAIFNFPGQKKGLYCKAHKQGEMENVISKRCKFPLCDTLISNKKYQGFCLYHAIGNNVQVARNYKTKENAVFSFLKDQFPDKTWIQDKRIEDGCSSYRPDIKLDLGFCVLIIEVDEQGHASYNCECESKRLYEISQDLGHRPIHLLRFNPDEYTRESDGIKVKSCWSSDKKDGVLRVSNNKKKEWQERLETLKRKIEECFDEENVPTTKLVFSEHFEINMKMQELFFG